MNERVMPGRTQGYEQKLIQIFVGIGVLPILLVIALVLFSLMSDHFLSYANIANVLRQSSYLTIVALGQMVVVWADAPAAQAARAESDISLPNCRRTADQLMGWCSMAISSSLLGNA